MSESGCLGGVGNWGKATLEPKKMKILLDMNDLLTQIAKQSSQNVIVRLIICLPKLQCNPSSLWGKY
jgi:hypothetical protein